MLSVALLASQNITPPKVPQFSNPCVLEPQQISESDLLAIRTLRAKAWRDAGMTDPAHFKDEMWKEEELDRTGYHFIIRSGDEIIAAARFSIHDDPTTLPDYAELMTANPALELRGPIGSLNRLVVDDRYKGKGFAKALLEPRLQLALRLGCETVVANVSDYRDENLEGHADLADYYKEHKFNKTGAAESFSGFPSALMVGDAREAWGSFKSETLAELIQKAWVPVSLGNDDFYRTPYARALVGEVVRILGEVQSEGDAGKVGVPNSKVFDRIVDVVPVMLEMYKTIRAHEGMDADLKLQAGNKLRFFDGKLEEWGRMFSHPLHAEKRDQPVDMEMLKVQAMIEHGEIEEARLVAQANARGDELFLGACQEAFRGLSRDFQRMSSFEDKEMVKNNVFQVVQTAFAIHSYLEKYSLTVRPEHKDTLLTIGFTKMFELDAKRTLEFLESAGAQSGNLETAAKAARYLYKGLFDLTLRPSGNPEDIARTLSEFAGFVSTMSSSAPEMWHCFQEMYRNEIMNEFISSLFVSWKGIEPRRFNELQPEDETVTLYMKSAIELYDAVTLSDLKHHVSRAAGISVRDSYVLYGDTFDRSVRSLKCAGAVHDAVLTGVIEGNSPVTQRVLYELQFEALHMAPSITHEEKIEYLRNKPSGSRLIDLLEDMKKMSPEISATS